MIRNRTGFSFTSSVGTVDEVIARLVSIGATHATITDRGNCFGHIEWDKKARKAGLTPHFGVELAVTNDAISDGARSLADRWTFLARDTMVPLHELVQAATVNFHYEPLLSTRQLRSDLITVTGRNPFFTTGRGLIGDGVPYWLPPRDVYIPLSPSTPRKTIMLAREHGYRFAACYDNHYPTPEDAYLWQAVRGRAASSQTWPQHILSMDEWRDSISATDQEIEAALANADAILAASTAGIVAAELPLSKSTVSLLDRCLAGAAAIGYELTDVRMARLTRELDMIKSKSFENYFHIVADIFEWATSKGIFCGPGRGSSAGSLVCYLLQITQLDPIEHGLSFERFIDINRSDLPDIDCDFQPSRRDEVFEYLHQEFDKPGELYVARLGTVSTFQAKSAVNIGASNIGLSKPEIDALPFGNSVSEILEKVKFGKNRANVDLSILGRIEGVPRHASRHAAGVLVSRHPIAWHAPFDEHIGAVQRDKIAAEESGFLKMDILGVSQLDMFARIKGVDFRAIPLSGPGSERAYDVLNRSLYQGVFQFSGQAVANLARRIEIKGFADIAALSALARPGPLDSGAAEDWIRRANGGAWEPLSPLMAPIVGQTHGVIVYQEQVMAVAHDLGLLAWPDVSTLRRAISRSKGVEELAQWRGPFVDGAISNGMTLHDANEIFDGIAMHGRYCLAAGTEIRLANSNRFQDSTITIDELHRVWTRDYHSLQDVQKKRGLPTVISMFPDGRGRPQQPIEVVYNGKRLCNTYVFCHENGTESSVTCTPDHLFIINGQWRPARDAVIGDKFASMKPSKQERVKTGNWEKGMDPDELVLVHVKDAGWIDTYDLVMPVYHNFMLANSLITHNSFNLAHAAAYGLISYWCAWLKAYREDEFYKATLEVETDTEARRGLLREMTGLGYQWLGVDANRSTDEFQIRDRAVLGPLGLINGFGDAKVRQILAARQQGNGFGKGAAAKVLSRLATGMQLPGDVPLATLDPVKTVIRRETGVKTLSDWPFVDIEQIHFARGVTEKFSINVKQRDGSYKRFDREKIKLELKNGTRIDTDAKLILGGMIDAPVAIKPEKGTGGFWLRDDTGRLFIWIARQDAERWMREINDGLQAGRSLWRIEGSLIVTPSDYRMLSLVDASSIITPS